MEQSNLRRKDTTKGAPLRVLSLDGGGVRGYAMLIILQELMYRAHVEAEGKPPKREEIPKPCEYFDLIAGTGTGGLIAIMLGRLRLDLETCMDVYVRMTKKVFETDKTIAGIPYKQTLFKASKLEEAIKACVREHTIFEDEGNDGTKTGGREFQDISSPLSANAAAVRRSMSVRSGASVGGLNSPASTRSSAIIPGPFARWGNADASLYDGRENRTKT
jgi:predicted acylesterase/phospholipase RssA